MAKWYYVIDGQEVGPLEAAELKRFADWGRLSPNQKVRRADSTEWHEAKQVKGLFSTGETQGSPLPPAANTKPMADSEDANTREKSVPRHRRPPLREKILVTSLGVIIVLIFSLYVFTSSGESDKQIANGSNSKDVVAPQHTIVRTEDLSMGRVRRIQVRVSVPEYYSRDAVDQVAKAIVEDTTATQPVNAISILFYGPDSSASGSFGLAMVEWAPNGQWGDADQVEAGDYTAFAYSIRYKEPAPPPIRGIDASGMTGLLGTPLPTESRLLEQHRGDPATGRDPSERYAVSASAAEIAAFFNKAMPDAGWAKDGSSTNTSLFFQKGNLMIGVLINSAGGTFTLMGS